ncbi:MAG: hypothetical protein C0436_03385 [Alphaproteobacteria bacterium]|nr:hypothetical protein [Alphaproteobacteria bacterium]
MPYGVRMEDESYINSVRTLLNRYCAAHKLPRPQLTFYDGQELRIFQSARGASAQVMLPQSMARDALEDTVLRIQGELANRDVLSKLYVITRKSHPQQVEAYEQFCMTNGILKPPHLIATHSVFADAVAIESHDCVVVSDATLALPISKFLAIVGHEVGHLLAPNLGAHASDAWLTRRRWCFLVAQNPPWMHRRGTKG